MTTPTLSPRLAEVEEFLARERTEFESYIATLPDSLMNTQPGEGQWSVQETLEHIGMVEDSIGRLVTNLAKQARELGHFVSPDAGSVLDCLEETPAINPALKLVAPERVRPTGTRTREESLERLRASRTRLLQAMHEANDLDLSNVGAPHPIFGHFTGYQWLVLVGRHELRHMKQIQNTVRVIRETLS